METLSTETLKTLLASTAQPAVTIYVPMHVTAAPPHITENQIRFKNLFHQAKELVRRIDKRSPLIEALEQHIVDMYGNLPFWETQTPGLLVCATPQSIRMFHLPVDTEEYVAVDDYFHLAPVMGLLHDDRSFHVLSLAQHNPKLYFGSLGTLTERSIGLPTSPETTLNLDETNQKTENQGAVTGNRASGHSSSKWGGFNGRGGARDPRSEDLLLFFRTIDMVVREKADCSLPLILAGTDSEIAEYRQLSTYPHILRTGLPEFLTTNNLRALYDAAHAIVRQEIIIPEHRAAVTEYQELRNAWPDRATRDPAIIRDAAEQGRVDKLLLSMSRQTTDTVQDHVEAVPRITFPNTVDLRPLQHIARAVWQTSGTVLNLLQNEMPNDALAAARLRY